MSEDEDGSFGASFILPLFIVKNRKGQRALFEPACFWRVFCAESINLNHTMVCFIFRFVGNEGPIVPGIDNVI